MSCYKRVHLQVNIIFVYALVIFSACGSRQAGISEDRSIDFYNATINTYPFITSFSEFKLFYGNEYNIVDSCSYKPVYHRQGKFYFDCINVEESQNVYFKKYLDTVFLHRVNFKENTTTKITLGNYVLTSDTTIDDVELEWNGSYKRLNKSAAFPYKNALGIYIDGSKKRPRTTNKKNVGRLVFRNDSLHYLIYDWSPMYSYSQWQEFNRIEDQLNKD